MSPEFGPTRAQPPLSPHPPDREATVDTGRRRLRPGERVAMLSDGVWKTAPPGAVLRGEPFPPTADCVRRLVGTARLEGSRDDTSAIVISARAIDADPEPEH